MSDDHETRIDQAMADAHALCTVCGEPAIYAYTWPWGESGYVCGMHAITLRHKAEALGRDLTLTSLRPGAVPPVTQDERVRYNAQILGAQQEVEAVKQRAGALFAANQELTAEVQQCRIDIQQLGSQIADLRAELDQSVKEKMQALSELGSANHDRARLQGILDAAQKDPPITPLAPPTP